MTRIGLSYHLSELRGPARVISMRCCLEAGGCSAGGVRARATHRGEGEHTQAWPGGRTNCYCEIISFHVHEIAWLDDHRHVCGHLTLWISITKPGIIDND